MFVTKAKLNEDEETAEENIKEEEGKKEAKGDMEKPKDKARDRGMDMKAVLKEISKRDVLAKRLAPHIGTFDHASKTLSEVARYGVRKLGLPCKRGHEESVLAGFLAAAKPAGVARRVQDTKSQNSSMVDSYIAGGK